MQVFWGLFSGESCFQFFTGKLSLSCPRNYNMLEFLICKTVLFLFIYYYFCILEFEPSYNFKNNFLKVISALSKISMSLPCVRVHVCGCTCVCVCF